jgi:transmembrane sensor
MHQPIEQYKNYEVAELQADEYFQQWVLYPDDSCNAFWQEFMTTYPDRATYVHTARELLLQLRFKKDLPSEVQQQRMWSGIQQQLEVPAPLHLVAVKGYRRWWQVAAIVAGILLLGAAGKWILFANNKQLYTTHNGETRVIALPDGSQVTLNANSSLEYEANWSDEQERHVWVKGEAYFEVAPKYNKRREPTRFVVHTSDLNVEVLGTSFNVNDRHAQTAVVLNTGKVRVDFDNKKMPQVVLEPGERLAFTTKTMEVHREKIKPSHYTSWKDGVLEFNDTPLSEVAQTLSDIYGLAIQFKTPEMKEILLSGTISCKDLAVFIKGIATTLDITIEQSQNTLIFSGKD